MMTAQWANVSWVELAYTLCAVLGVVCSLWSLYDAFQQARALPREASGPAEAAQARMVSGHVRRRLVRTGVLIYCVILGLGAMLLPPSARRVNMRAVYDATPFFWLWILFTRYGFLALTVGLTWDAVMDVRELRAIVRFLTKALVLQHESETAEVRQRLEVIDEKIDINTEKLDANTEISEKAFHEANTSNQKIADLSRMFDQTVKETQEQKDKGDDTNEH